MARLHRKIIPASKARLHSVHAACPFWPSVTLCTSVKSSAMMAPAWSSLAPERCSSTYVRAAWEQHHSFHLAAVMDVHLSPACGALPVIHRQRRNRLNGRHPREHLPEDDMMPIKVRSRGRRDTELRAVSVWPCVRHAKEPRLRVRRDETFGREGRAIDRLAARAVPADKVAALYAQAGDDAVDRAPFRMHRRPRERMHALVATDEMTKVLGRLRESICPKLEHDALGRGLAANTKADPHLRVWLGRLGLTSRGRLR